MPTNTYYNPTTLGTQPLSEFERQHIRTFMGFPRLVGANPEFDSILDAVNGTVLSDGGACIVQVRYILSRLIDLDQNIKNFSSIPITMSKDVDYARQELVWRYVTGPSIVQELSIIMSFPIPANYFAPAPTVGFGDSSYRYKRIQNPGY